MTPIEQAWADLRASRALFAAAQRVRDRLVNTPTVPVPAVIAANLAIVAARIDFLLKRAALAALLHP